jgi:hypothetical protein
MEVARFRRKLNRDAEEDKLKGYAEKSCGAPRLFYWTNGSEYLARSQG